MDMESCVELSGFLFSYSSTKGFSRLTTSVRMVEHWSCH
jgi:hypothetical protein